MKKLLLTVASVILSIGAFAQVPSPFWVAQNTNFPIVSAGIKYMDAISPNVVWAIGYDGTAPNKNTNMFTRTINGGTSYTAGIVWPDTNTYVPASIEGIDANTAWVSSYLRVSGDRGSVFKTTDGGVTWNNMASASMFTIAGVSFVDFVAFTSPSVGIALGDPAPTNKFEIYRTIDGGASWSQIPGANIPNANSGEYGLVDVYTKVANHIWFGTNANRIYHSADAGQTWSVSATITGTIAITASSGIRDISFRDPNNGLALMSASSTNYLYSTNDGGNTWTQISPIDPNMGLNDGCAVPGTTVYASGGAASTNTVISYSPNNGVNWTSWGGSGIQYLKIDFVDDVNGWAGSFSNNITSSIGGMWKYTGPSLSGATPPTAQFTIPPVACFGSVITATNGSTGNPTPTYSWSATGSVTFAPSATATSPTLTFGGLGNYTITLVATNSVGVNSTSQVISITTCSAPSAGFNMASSTCAGTLVATTNTSSGSPTPTYVWSTNPAGSVTYTPNNTVASPTISFGTPGTYSVMLMATSISGTSSAMKTITVNPVPTLSVTSTASILCAGNSATLTASGATSYTWNTSSNLTSIVISPTISTAYSFTGTNTFGCKSTKSFVQTVSPCTGVGSITSASEQFNLYPNPSNGVINISISSATKGLNILVTDALGNVIYSEKIITSSAENKVINLQNSAKGLYFVNIYDDSIRYHQKIVIE